MGRKSKSELADILLGLMPADGAAIGNLRLGQEFSERLDREVSERQSARSSRSRA